MLDPLPGAVGVSKLCVYDTVTPDGLHGGTPHLHLCCTEAYVVTSGTGSVQTLSGQAVSPSTTYSRAPSCGSRRARSTA